jgi:hypothetical protein
MVKIIAEDMILQEIDVEDVLAFLRTTSWRQIEYSNTRLTVFEGPKDDNGRPIILSLPTSNEFIDARERIADAINLLAASERTTPYSIIQKIRSVNRDIIQLRMLISTDAAPSLESAYYIIQGLRHLIMYSACMEKDPRRYFEQPLAIGTEQVRRCRFGHTFHGSFGYTIETPISAPSQLRDSHGRPNQLRIPVERKVVERITRGFLNIQRAVRKEDPAEISRNYDSGLNANMCSALLGMSRGMHGMEMEYSVVWSPRYELSPDLIKIEPIRLEENAYRYLEEATYLIKESIGEPIQNALIEEVDVTSQIQGPVIKLSSIAKSDHTITVSWGGGAVQISLNQADYQKACDAHRDGLPISVSGKLKVNGKKSWILLNPTNFIVQSLLK